MGSLKETERGGGGGGGGVKKHSEILNDVVETTFLGSLSLTDYLFSENVGLPF